MSARHLRLVSDSEPDSTLRDAVKAAVEENQLELYGRARTADNWRSVSFGFVLHLRSHPALRDLDSIDAADTIEPVLEELLADAEIDEECVEHDGPINVWMRALGNFNSADKEQDPEQDFLHCWERLEPRPDLRHAVEQARVLDRVDDPFEFGDRLAHRRFAGRRVLLRTCRILAEMSPDGEFPLSQYALERERVGHQRTISDWITWAMKEEFLVRVAPYRIGRSRGQRRAARYRLGPRLGGGST